MEWVRGTWSIGSCAREEAEAVLLGRGRREKGSSFPYKSILPYVLVSNGMLKEVSGDRANGRKDKDRVIEGVKNSSSIVLAKSFKEIEGKYVEY
ncbi:hypothetical protein Tco_1540043 [Tanacetum coccineum]